MKRHITNSVLYLFLIVLILAFTAGCASSGGGDIEVSKGGPEKTAASGSPAAEAPTEALRLSRKEGPAKIELDLSAFRKAGLEFTYGEVNLHVERAENGERVFNQEQHFHDDRSPESMATEWSTAEWPEEELKIFFHIGAGRYDDRYFSVFRSYGPIPYNGSSSNEKQLTITPYPFYKTGVLSLTAKNETGIGNLNHGLGVFLQNVSSGTSYHYHLLPGKEYLTYHSTVEGIEAGSYRFTIHAWKDGWPYYGNAVWEGKLEVQEGETATLSGSLSKKTAPWNMGIGEDDLQIEGLAPVYETEFDDRDPRMGNIHVAEGGSAGLEDGILVVEGDGELGGGLDISVPTGSNTLIRFRAKVPENGEFFFNTRAWGGSRMAVIVNPERGDEPARFESFSTAEGRDLPAARFDQNLPALAAGQWHDFVFIDDGERLYIFVDETFYAVFPISEELPAKGDLHLEWHRPCSFDSLSVASFESMKPPEGL
jgi:hypothetical protein